MSAGALGRSLTHLMRRFTSLGELLDAHIAQNKIKVSDLVEELNVSMRTFRRWRSGDSAAGDETLRAIARSQMIPYEALIAANTGLTVLYEPRTRRFSRSEFEREIVDELPDLSEVGFEDRVRPIRRLEDAMKVMRVEGDLYEGKRVPPEVIVAAGQRIEELNFLVSDGAGFNSGHLVCFWLKAEAQKKIREGGSEAKLRVTDFADRDQPDQPGGLHIYAVYASCRRTALRILTHAGRFMFSETVAEIPRSSRVSAIPITTDGVQLAKTLGLRKTAERLSPLEYGDDTEVKGAYYESKLEDLKLGL